jgi:hypothetical protein
VLICVLTRANPSPDRADQVRQLFELLSKQKRIPDHIEIVVNIEASPRLNHSVETTDLPPVLSYCSTADHYDLIGIGWQYHRCLKEKYKDNAMCKVGWDPDVIRKEHPWGGREGQALWRGSPTGGRRRCFLPFLCACSSFSSRYVSSDYWKLVGVDFNPRRAIGAGIPVLVVLETIYV